MGGGGWWIFSARTLNKHNNTRINSGHLTLRHFTLAAQHTSARFQSPLHSCGRTTTTPSPVYIYIFFFLQTSTLLFYYPLVHNLHIYTTIINILWLFHLHPGSYSRFYSAFLWCTYFVLFNSWNVKIKRTTNLHRRWAQYVFYMVGGREQHAADTYHPLNRIK